MHSSTALFALVAPLLVNAQQAYNLPNYQPAHPKSSSAPDVPPGYVPPGYGKPPGTPYSTTIGASHASVYSEPPPKASTTAPAGSPCAEKCWKEYDACRVVPHANQSGCVADLAKCVGYAPFDKNGKFQTPTACSTSSSVPHATSQSPNQPSGSSSAVPPPPPAISTLVPPPYPHPSYPAGNSSVPVPTGSAPPGTTKPVPVTTAPALSSSVPSVPGTTSHEKPHHHKSSSEAHPVPPKSTSAPPGPPPYPHPSHPAGNSSVPLPTGSMPVTSKPVTTAPGSTAPASTAPAKPSSSSEAHPIPPKSTSAPPGPPNPYWHGPSSTPGGPNPYWHGPSSSSVGHPYVPKSTSAPHPPYPAGNSSMPASSGTAPGPTAPATTAPAVTTKDSHKPSSSSSSKPKKTVPVTLTNSVIVPKSTSAPPGPPHPYPHPSYPAGNSSIPVNPTGTAPGPTSSIPAAATTAPGTERIPYTVPSYGIHTLPPPHTLLTSTISAPPACPTTLTYTNPGVLDGCDIKQYGHTSTALVDCHGCRELVTSTYFNPWLGLGPACQLTTYSKPSATTTVTSCKPSGSSPPQSTVKSAVVPSGSLGPSFLTAPPAATTKPAASGSFASQPPAKTSAGGGYGMPPSYEDVPQTAVYHG